MEENKNPNGVNNEAEVVKKAAPPPMKKAKKGETSQAVLDAAKKAVVEKNIEKAKREEAKKLIQADVGNLEHDEETLKPYLNYR